MIRIIIRDDVPAEIVAQAIIEAGERIGNGEHPDQVRDRQGNTIGWVELDLREQAETEETVTLIAGVLHHWSWFPGTWLPWKPEAGQLMRVRR